VRVMCAVFGALFHRVNLYDFEVEIESWHPIEYQQYDFLDCSINKCERTRCLTLCLNVKTPSFGTNGTPYYRIRMRSAAKTAMPMIMGQPTFSRSLKIKGSKIFITVLSTSDALFRCGNGSSGIGTPRNLHKGSQPSVTLNSSKRLSGFPGTCLFQKNSFASSQRADRFP